MDNVVYVLDKSGQPLMPTTLFRKVRLMLKSGKAKAVRTKPFTIQLTYEPETHIVQDVVLGMDPGRTNIGLGAVRKDGESLYSAKCETCNKDIPKHMADRKQHRQASRRGERKRRQRRAREHGTTFNEGAAELVVHENIRFDATGEQLIDHELTVKVDIFRDRILPGCDKPIRNKYITNTEAKFNNRKRPAGWLTPTATQLLRTHERLIDLVCSILPVSKVVLEVNKFAFMAMDNPKIQRWQYQRGPLYGVGSVKDAVFAQQDGYCLFCKRKIDHYHHIVPRSKGGSDTLPNIAGLCERHHNLIHKEAYLIKQFRKHDRRIIYAQRSRSYYQQIPGEKKPKKVAVNRKKACVTDPVSGEEKKQTEDSLGDWFNRMVEEHGIVEANKMRSQLTVRKSSRTYVLPNMTKPEAAKVLVALKKEDKKYQGEVENRHLPGSIFKYLDKMYVLKGNHGNSVQTFNFAKADIPRSQVTFIAHNSGLVYI